MTQSSEQLPPSGALARGYEGDDLNVRGLLIFLICFLVTAVVIHIMLWQLLKHYFATPRAEDAAPSAVNLLERFPEPQLQPSIGHNTTPQEDLAALHQDENRIFNALGWKTKFDSSYPVIPDQIVTELQQHHATSQPAKAGAK